MWQVLDETEVNALVEIIAERDGYWPDNYDSMTDQLFITFNGEANRSGV